MRRLAVGLLVASLFTAACSSDQKLEQPTAPQASTPLAKPSLSVSPGQPADSSAIESLITLLYYNLNNGNGPYNSTDTRFQQIAKLYTPPPPYNMAAVDSNTYSLIGSVISDYQSGKLNQVPTYTGSSGAGTEAAVIDLINLLLRYAGIDGSVCAVAVDCNFTLYQPGSSAQILATPSGNAGISLPPGTGTVTQPTVISVFLDLDPNDTLVTDLDRYPFRYIYSSSSPEGKTIPFGNPVVVEVCLDPANVYGPGAFGRLAIAHNVPEPPPFTNIQILPAASSGFLTNCDALAPTVGAAGSRSANFAARGWHFLTGRLASIIAPQPLYATTLLSGTGTTGTTKTLSPFEAVDPQGNLTANPPTTQSLPQGSTFAPPSVKLLTPKLVAMPGIPVTFTVTSGTGSISDGTTTGSSITVTTGADGVASLTTWTPSAGTNTVQAVPAIPCAAPVVDAPNCGYISPASLTFTATANPPVKLDFGTQPPATTTAGVTFTVTVKVEDLNGAQVPAYNGPVTVNLTPANGAVLYQGTTAQPSGVTVSASNGLATFSNLDVQKAGTGYTLTASATLANGATTATSSSFNITASTAASLAINGGNNQTAPESSTLGVTAGTVAPSVLVTDAYANPVGGAGVSFVVASGAGSVGSSSATTNASGVASTTWTIVAGLNSMNASITALGPLPYVSFTATGTSTSKTLVDCPAASNNSDDLGRGFYVPLTGNTGIKINSLKQATVYLSAGGPAAGPPKRYGITLTARADAWNGTLIASSQQYVYLNGNSGQSLATEFPFSGPLTVPNGTKYVAFSFTITDPGDGAKLLYNVGPCGLGNTNCSNLPASCGGTTETNDITTLPLSTFRRRGVGVKLLGS